ncbi:MAG: MFS transporter [Gemmataceae bacterium]
MSDTPTPDAPASGISMARCTVPPPVRQAAVVRGATHALLLLVLINLFNYIDRQVLAAVEPHVRAEFFPPGPDGKEPADAKTLTAVLSFAFLATYMLTAPLFGALATRMRRWWLIAIGVGVWTLASGASGLAPLLGDKLGGGMLVLLGFAMPTAYLVMLLTRCLVGLGEAVYGPVAPDIISDLFPVSKRGQVLAWFYAAIPFGGALGYALGSVVVNNLNLSWPWAFYLVVPPGLALSVWCLFVPEPPRGQTDLVTTTKRNAQWSDYWFLLKTPSYLLNTAGMTFMCFAIGGLAFWAPGFLADPTYRGVSAAPVPAVFGLDPVFFFGVMTALLGLLATILGGVAGDLLRKRYSGSYFLVSGVAMCVAFPALLWLVYARDDFPLAWVPMGTFVFCLFFNTGPTNTIIANVTHPLLRARAFAFNILIIHLFGDAISPIVMGAIIGKNNRYDLAFQFVSVTVLLGGLLWLWGAAFLQRDTERSSRHLPELQSQQQG